MFCENCGSQIADGARFCPVCGSVVEPDIQETATSPAQQEEAAPAQQAQPEQQYATGQQWAGQQAQQEQQYGAGQQWAGQQAQQYDAQPQQPYDAQPQYQQPYNAQPQYQQSYYNAQPQYQQQYDPGQQFQPQYGAQPQWGAPQPEKKSNKMLIIIIAAVVAVIGLGVGAYFLFFHGDGGNSGPDGPKTNPSGSGYAAGQAFINDDLSITMDNAFPWTKAETFLSPGFKYIQIWVHMTNNGTSAVKVPSYDRFYIEYSGAIPSWMSDFTLYDKDGLKKQFGADNRTCWPGEVVEGELSHDKDYLDSTDVDKNRTIAPGETFSAFLAYMAPADAASVKILYYASPESARADKDPLAVFTVAVQADAPVDMSKAMQYADPDATAREKSTYKRPDHADFDGMAEDYFSDENELRSSVERNDGKYILEPRALNGGWLGEIDMDDDDTIRSFNAELAIGADGTATMEIDWYQDFDEWEKTYTDLTDANTVFTGKWNENGSMELSAPGVGKISIMLFFERENGYQYARGHFEAEGKENRFVPEFCLIRPGWVKEPYLDVDYMNTLKSKVTYSNLAPEGWTQEGAIAGNEPAEPSEAPTQPSEAPTQPGEAPTQPPTQPTEPSTPATPQGDITGKPTEEEFNWLYDAVGMRFPADTQVIEDLSVLGGQWKAMILFLDDDDTTIYSKELCTAEMTITNGEYDLDIYPFKEIILELGEWQDVNTYYYSDNKGVHQDDYINLTGGLGYICLHSFIITGGKQCMVGLVTLPSGEYAYIGLMRP